VGIGISPFKFKQVFGVGPAFPLLAYAIIQGYPNIGEVNFIDFLEAFGRLIECNYGANFYAC
jgi:hypothetical protein